MGWKWDGNGMETDGNGWNFDEIRIIRWVRYWVLEKWNHFPEITFKILIS